MWSNSLILITDKLSPDAVMHQGIFFFSTPKKITKNYFIIQLFYNGFLEHFLVIKKISSTYLTFRINSYKIQNVEILMLLKKERLL